MHSHPNTGDGKPCNFAANVLIDVSGHAKLGDVGLARILQLPSICETERNSIAGTWTHMAPEVAHAYMTSPYCFIDRVWLVWYAKGSQYGRNSFLDPWQLLCVSDMCTMPAEHGTECKAVLHHSS